jgi:phosphoribosyl 1,2-cyclic phosphate phosphodiesterase
LKITFLGTGTSQGIPVIGSKHPVCLSNNPKDKRLRVSVMVSWDSYNYVIDCGPDFRQQMLVNNVVRIDGILFTHEHSDHASIKERFDYIFADENRYPGAPAVEINTIKNNRPFRIGNLMAIPVEAQHNRLQVFGFRIQDFVYLTDVKSMEKLELEKIKGVNTLVVNALRIEPHHSHFNLEEALEFIDIVRPKTAYLTHISHLLGFHDEVEKQLPDNVHLAYDNLVIEV